VLIDIVDRINGHLSSNHLFGRYGGDEFAILLPGMGETNSTKFAEYIKQDIERANNNELQLSYTVSIGVLTVIPTSNISIDDLYISCDKALYMAKESGRNCVYRIEKINEDVVV
jgi:diguanylate cyclase (GGDEF)-like protein